MGILNKLRLVTLGTIHDLLDKAIDMNSPTALRQYVRDLEDAADKMRNEAAVQAGSLRTLKRDRETAARKVELLRIQTQAVLAGPTATAASTVTLARSNASLIITLQKSVDAADSSITTQTQTSQQLDQAVAALDAKHTEMVTRVHQLEMLDRQTKAKESGAGAMKLAQSALGNGADNSIDDLANKMQARADVADEKFDRALAGFHDAAADPAHEDDVAALLADLAPKKPELAATS